VSVPSQRREGLTKETGTKKDFSVSFLEFRNHGWTQVLMTRCVISAARLLIILTD
jgi:hypothetical protein